MKTIIAIVTYSTMAGAVIAALPPHTQMAAMIPACVLSWFIVSWGVHHHD